ncbi:hypothetical protein ACFU5Y_38575 [Streptomyces gardneri]|uniref:hypothetical protein n=1 Tax=Streptomyces gardneri TaxID=66892 RepID=UPI0036C637A0
MQPADCVFGFRVLLKSRPDGSEARPIVGGQGRELARLTMPAREAEGLDTAFRHLEEADGVIAAAPEDAEIVHAWPVQGVVHYRRARALAEAERVESSGLGRFSEAVTRLATASARCRKADLTDAADILDALRQDFLTRR